MTWRLFGTMASAILQGSHQARHAPVIARFVGLCVLLLAAWPAAADVRVAGVAPAVTVETAAPHAAAAQAGAKHGRLLPGLPKTYDESERDTPAFGYADADDPEPDAAPAGSDRLPPQRVSAILARGVVDATPRHRVCAAPPRGPPAA